MSAEIAVLAVVVVLLLAIILWLLIDRRKGSPPPRDQTSSETPDQRTSEHRPVRYSQLVLGDAEEPLATVESLDASVELRRSPLPMNEQQLGWLQSIFKHAPRLAKSVSRSTNTYVMKFSPEVAHGIRNGSLDIMRSAQGGLRGIVVDARGTIVSQATLVPASGVRMTAIVAGAFQVLAVVTAQYYLPQINRRLLQIERGVQDIQAHLTAQDKAVLVHSLKQLRSVQLSLEEGDLNEVDVTSQHVNLDAIDRDSGRIMETYRDHMERYKNEFEELDLARWLNPDFEAATDKMTEYENAAFICLQAMRVKSMTAQFRYTMLGSDFRVSQALHDLQELKKGLTAWQEDQMSFLERFKKRIQDDTVTYLDRDYLREMFGGDDSLTKRRQRIIHDADHGKAAITNLYDEFKQTIDQATRYATQRLASTSEPLTLAVELDDQGDIEYVYELAETT